MYKVLSCCFWLDMLVVLLWDSLSSTYQCYEWGFLLSILDISTPFFSRGTVIFPYVYAFIWSAIPLGGIGSYSLESYGTSCTLQWDENRAYITFMSLFCIATPAVLITFTYGLILLKCRRSSKNLRVWRRDSNKMTAKDSYLIKVSWKFILN